MADVAEEIRADTPQFGVDSAAETYNERLEHCGVAVSELAAVDRRYVRLRVAAFVFTLLVGFVCLGEKSVSWIWISIPLLIFAIVLAMHGRLLRRLRNARAREQFYLDAAIRLTAKWTDSANTGDEFQGRSARMVP